MKNKIVRSAKHAMLLLMLLLIGYSCSDDPVQDFEKTEWNIENFTVEAYEWNWNPSSLRWEAVRPLSFIDEFIYEKGAVIGYVFIAENGKEVQYQLPHTLNLRDGEFVYTQTLDYNFDYKTKRATFLIKPSDSFEDLEAKKTYDFRIAMIW
jgi:hypothetical protein